LELDGWYFVCYNSEVYSQSEYSRSKYPLAITVVARYRSRVLLMKKELAPEWALLGLLTQKPMHGYELHRYFTAPSALGQVWYLGLSQMYKLLKELEGQGYVEVTVELQENYPARKVYHITPSGRAAFLQWMEKPVRNTRLIRVEFLAKLFLAQLLGSEMIERVIHTQLEACQAQLTRLQARACPELGLSEARPEFRRRVEGQSRRACPDWELGIENWELTFEHLVLRFRQGQIQAIIDWLETCRRMFLEERRIANGELEIDH
jgi:PadR family transcriptional regulator AphA